MGLDRTGHADRAEQERNEADEIQKAVEILQRRPEVPLPFGHRVVFESEPLDLRRKRLDPLFHIGAIGKLHIHAVARDVARLEQVGFGEILQRNVNPRRKRARGRSLSRHLPQCARDGEFLFADLDRVAHPGLELEEKAFVDESAPAGTEVNRGRRGHSLDDAIEWEIASQRADLREAGGTASRKNSHAGKADFSRLGAEPAFALERAPPWRASSAAFPARG